MNEHIDLVTLNEYLDERLPAAERANVAEHLALCSHCRQQFSELEMLFTALAEAPAVALSRDLSADVMNAIAARAQAMNAPAAAGTLPWWLLVVQTVVAGAVVVLVWPWVIGMIPIDSGIAWPRLWWAGLTTLKDNFLNMAWAWLMSEWATLQFTLPDTPKWLNLALPGWGLLLLAAGLCWLAGAYWGFTDYQVQNGEER